MSDTTSTLPPFEPLFQQASALYAAFIDEIKPLVGAEHDDGFGKVVVAPSSMRKMIDARPNHTTKDIEKFEDLCNTTNDTIKALAENNGFKVVDFYQAMNSRGVGGPPAPAGGPTNHKEAEALFSARGQFLVASFTAQPDGKLMYWGLVPSKVFFDAVNETLSAFMPTNEDMQLLQRNKNVTSYVPMPNRAMWMDLVSRVVTTNTVAGVPVICIPQLLHEEQLATFVVPSSSSSNGY